MPQYKVIYRLHGNMFDHPSECMIVDAGDEFLAMQHVFGKFTPDDGYIEIISIEHTGGVMYGEGE